MQTSLWLKSIIYSHLEGCAAVAVSEDDSKRARLRVGKVQAKPFCTVYCK